MRLGLARQGIDRLDGALTLLRHVSGSAAGETVAPFHRAALVLEALLLDGRDRVAAFDRGQIEQVELRIVRCRRPVLAAGARGASLRWALAAQPMAAWGVDLHILVGVVVERLAGLRIEPGGPG